MANSRTRGQPIPRVKLTFSRFSSAVCTFGSFLIHRQLWSAYPHPLGLVAGATAASFSTPADFVKTNLQMKGATQTTILGQIRHTLATQVFSMIVQSFPLFSQLAASYGFAFPRLGTGCVSRGHGTAMPHHRPAVCLDSGQLRGAKIHNGRAWVDAAPGPALLRSINFLYNSFAIEFSSIHNPRNK